MNEKNPFREIKDNVKRRSCEYKLQVACVEHLRSAFPGLLFFHCPNQTRNATEAFFNKKMGVLAGAPDLVITWAATQSPQVAAIELKAPGGTQSSEQNKFLSSAAHRGWKTQICRSVQALHAALKSWGVRPIHDCITEPNYDTKQEKFAKAFDFYQS